MHAESQFMKRLVCYFLHFLCCTSFLYYREPSLYFLYNLYWSNFWQITYYHLSIAILCLSSRSLFVPSSTIIEIIPCIVSRASRISCVMRLLNLLEYPFISFSIVVVKSLQLLIETLNRNFPNETKSIYYFFYVYTLQSQHCSRLYVVKILRPRMYIMDKSHLLWVSLSIQFWLNPLKTCLLKLAALYNVYSATG